MNYLWSFVAAATPPALLLLVTLRCRADLRRRLTLFSLLTLLWLAPVWIQGAVPVSFDFLTGEAPFDVLRPEGYLNRNFLLNDVPLQFQPLRLDVLGAIREGVLPFLATSAGGAVPLLANSQAAVLDPLQWLAIAFDAVAGAGFGAVVYASARILLCLVGMYLFTRRILPHEPAAIFSAVAYTFCTFNMTFLHFPKAGVAMLLPWVLLGIARAAEGARWWPASLALPLYGMFVAGHYQTVVHTLVVIVPWSVFVLAANRKVAPAAATRVAVGVAIALACSAPQWLSFAELVEHSQRRADLEAGHALSAPPMTLRNLVPYLLPNFYGNPRVHNYRHETNFNDLASGYAGLITLALAFIALWRDPRRAWLWGGVAVIALLLSTPPGTFRKVLDWLPLFSLTSTGRLRFVWDLAIAILGGLGFAALLKESRLTDRLLVLLFPATVTLIVIASWPVSSAFGVRRLLAVSLVAASIAFIPILLRFSRRRTVQLVIGGLLLDLFVVVGLYNPAIHPGFVYPSTPLTGRLQEVSGPHRFTALGHTFMPNAAVAFGLEEVRPHDPFAFGRYVHFLDAAGLDRSTYFPRFDTVPARHALQFLGVRHLVTSAEPVEKRMAQESGYEELYAGSDGAIFVDTLALPRFFVPRGVLFSDEPMAAFVRGGDAGTVAMPRADVQLSPGSASIELQGRQSARVRVASEGRTILASSIAAIPGWRITIDERRAVPLEINGAFLAVDVPAGEHVIDFLYVAPGFRKGVVAAAAGLLLLIVISAREEKARRRLALRGAEPSWPEMQSLATSQRYRAS
jgi:hypothetical protein